MNLILSYNKRVYNNNQEVQNNNNNQEVQNNNNNKVVLHNNNNDQGLHNSHNDSHNKCQGKLEVRDPELDQSWMPEQRLYRRREKGLKKNKGNREAGNQ
jgi:hypothetical protein